MAYGGLLALLRGSAFAPRVTGVLAGVGALLVACAIFTLGLDAFWVPQRWAEQAFYLSTAVGFVFGYIVDGLQRHRI